MVRLAALALVAALAGAVATSAAAAAPRPDGTWRIVSDKDGKPLALIRVQTVGGGQLTGVLTASLRGDNPARLCVKCPGARRNQRILGMQVLWGVQPAPGDPLKWTNGSILDPDNGSTYGCEVTESPDGRTLTVRGYLGIAMLGRTQTWRRVG
jgi:uncharacterized protein (DUF2147 family)